MPTKPTGPHTVSRKALAVLTLIVLLLHVLLLQGESPARSRNSKLPAPAFSTRTLEPVAVHAAATAPTAQQPPFRRPALTHRMANATPPAASHRSTPQSPDPTPAPPTRTAAEMPAPTPTARAPREAVRSDHNYRIPGTAQVQYEVTGSKFPHGAKAELMWQPDGTRYDARLTFNAGFLPVMRQTSRGEITAQGLAPTRFSDKKRSEVAAHFVREQGKITFSANTPDAPLLEGAQDRLSVLLQLASMVAGEPDAYPQASTLTLPVVGPRDADLWLFTVEGIETLALPGGELSTLKLQRNPRREFDQKIELWLAPGLGYLPARVRMTDASGDFYDQQWLSGQPATP